MFGVYNTHFTKITLSTNYYIAGNHQTVYIYICIHVYKILLIN
jgi:hypothetical protein